MKIRKNKGLTKIELLLVIGFVSMFVSIIYVLYQNADDKRMASAEITNLQVLVNKLKSATTASDYSQLDTLKLNDYGIFYKSEFPQFDIKGLSSSSFQVDYKSLTSRQCNDFVLKTSAMKGEYNLDRKINGQDVTLNISNVIDSCNNDINDVKIIFSGLNIANIAMVNPGVPKPPPSYAGEGAWELDYPDRGDVPTNLDSSGKNVGNPNKPTPGTYKPPTYIVAGNPALPSGGGKNPGEFFRPTYPPNNPLGPLTNPPDSGNEWVPAVPPVPPRPPATAPPILSREIIVIATGKPFNLTITLEDGVMNFPNHWGCITNGSGVNYHIIPLGYNFYLNPDRPANSPIIGLYPNDYNYWNITPVDGYNVPLNTFIWKLKGKIANHPGIPARKMTVNEFNNLYSYRILCDYDSN